MAHPNIKQRREKIGALVRAGVSISGGVRAALAAEFGCSRAAISADLIAASGIHCTPAMRRTIHARDGQECQYCGRTSGSEFIVEHVIPAGLGGLAQAFNLVIACQRCNATKRRRVWVPRNLDAITADRPDWRARVLEAADAR